MADFKAKCLFAAAFLCGFAPVNAADIFKWQDDQGKTHYSDYAQGDAQALAIDPGFTFIGVKAVYDGDTVQLQDGRKVRLLGINTPETAHRDSSAEAGGETAKAWLQKTLQDKKVRLQTDVEKQDKYGRALAYLFTEDGLHINLQLVIQGLAAVTIHPPNLLYVDQLLAAERKAEAAHLGIWNTPDYAVQPVETLSRDNYRGWKRLSGRVTGIRRSGKYTYLQISPTFSARIDKSDLPLFGDLDAYKDKQVELRGWLTRSKDRYTMPLRHPSATRIIP